jgi:hypothetical protein
MNSIHRILRGVTGAAVLASIFTVAACGPQPGEPSSSESASATAQPPCDGAVLHARTDSTQCNSDMQLEQVEQDQWCCPDGTTSSTTSTTTTDVPCGSALEPSAPDAAPAPTCTYRHISSICAGCGIGCTQPFFEDCLSHSCASKINMISNSTTGDCVVVCVVPATGEQP